MFSVIPDICRILVVTKPGFLGDNIVATPFLRRLAEARPKAGITLLAGPASPTLLQGCPYVEALMTGESEIRAGRFDAAFLLNRSFHSAWAAARARIPLRIGHDTEQRGFLLTRRVKYDWSKPDRECSLDLLRSMAIPAETALPELWISPEEAAEAGRILQQRGVDEGAMLVGMQPGSHDPDVRQWPPERFAAVADRLAGEMSARVLLLGADDECAAAESVARSMKRQPIDLAGQTSLRQALAIISQCRLWIGNDGGLLHAAVALGCATVGIFGPTKAPRWGYDPPRHRTMVVYPDTPSNDTAVIRRCVDAITPQSVYDAALAVLEESREKVLTS